MAKCAGFGIAALVRLSPADVGDVHRKIGVWVIHPSQIACAPMKRIDQRFAHATREPSDEFFFI